MLRTNPAAFSRCQAPSHLKLSLPNAVGTIAPHQSCRYQAADENRTRYPALELVAVPLESGPLHSCKGCEVQTTNRRVQVYHAYSGSKDHSTGPAAADQLIISSGQHQ